MGTFKHYSVLLRESIEALDIDPDGTYADLTLGGGGHSYEIAKRLSSKGRLIAIDRDPEAIIAARARLSEFLDRVTIVNDNYENIETILEENHINALNGAIADLGVSSYQLDESSRGFSYKCEAPLDMRMSSNDTLSAYDVVNAYSEDELKRIIYTYGEEKFGAKIARAICENRENKPIETTTQLSEIIKSVFPAAARAEKHPAKRTFQAIRIEVNHELDSIPKALRGLVRSMKKGGVIAVISFHSLEDRAVKETFREFMDGCTCPKDFPVCVCGFEKSLEAVSRKPILPSERELSENNRSHSAKLRVVRKI